MNKFCFIPGVGVLHMGKRTSQNPLRPSLLAIDHERKKELLREICSRTCSRGA